MTTLTDLDACADGLVFAKKHKTLRAAWDECEDLPWMTWLVGRAHTHGKMTRQRLVRCVVEWALVSAHLLPDESVADLGVVASWTAGLVDIAEVRAARGRLWQRRTAAGTAAYAAGTAAYAAYAAALPASRRPRHAAGTAGTAAYAAYAAAYAAYAAARSVFCHVVRASVTIDEVCEALGMNPDGRVK